MVKIGFLTGRQNNCPAIRLPTLTLDPMNSISLRTERLMLRRFGDQDLEVFAQMNSNPEVMKYYPAVLDRPQSDAFMQSITQHWEQHGFGLFAITLVNDGRLIGYTGLKIPSFQAWFTPCVEIGWRFMPETWGKGYATEAAHACLDFGFTTIGLNRIVSFTTIQNLRSERVMERLGMKRVGHFENPRVPEGHPLRPHVLYAIDNPRIGVQHMEA
jgi:RimJ/RimL family protein N-acetyltransferase